MSFPLRNRNLNRNRPHPEGSSPAAPGGDSELSLEEAEVKLARGETPGIRTQNNLRSPVGAQQDKSALNGGRRRRPASPLTGLKNKGDGPDPGFHPALILPRPHPRASDEDVIAISPLADLPPRNLRMNPPAFWIVHSELFPESAA